LRGFFNEMKNDKKIESKVKEQSGIYKGYDIAWLRKETDHPDFKLVAEYEKEYGEIK